MQRRQALKLLGGSAAAVGLASLGGAAARAGASLPKDDGWHFRVRRHGEVIGEHRFTFSRRGGDFVVDVAIDIAVDVLGITLFRFTHSGEEVWRDGWLHALTSTTDDDGTHWQVDSERRDGALRGRVNGAGFEVPGFVVPASLWHHATLEAQVLLDTIDAGPKAVRSETLGAEPVTVGGRAVQASHVRLTGELERDVWYGPDGGIARVTFPARDGSLITLERQ